MKDNKRDLQKLNTTKDRIEIILSLMMKKPELILITPQGGTVHKYPLTGGKTTFERYLSCYTGSCKFFNDMEQKRVKKYNILYNLSNFSENFYKTGKNFTFSCNFVLQNEILLCPTNCL